jgi:citrate synthase
MTFNNGLGGGVAAETMLSQVDGQAGRLVLRGHQLQDIAGQRGVEWLIEELWRGFAEGNLSESMVRRELGTTRVAVFADVLPLLPQASRLAPIEALRLLVGAVFDDAADLRLPATVAVGLAAALRARAGAAPVRPVG